MSRPIGTTKADATRNEKPLGVRLRPEYRALLDALCEARGESQREVIEAALRALKAARPL
jgi:hypothetical protein